MNNDEDKYGSKLPFLDLLFNGFVAVVAMLFLAIILINPIAEEGDIEKKGEFIVQMSWERENEDDLDLWVEGPAGNPVGFRNTESGVIHYERDDLGLINDKTVVDGKTVQVKNNEETTVIRGIVPGTYRVSVHYYRDYEPVNNGPRKVEVKVIKLNPTSSIVYQQQLFLEREGSILNFYKFTVNSEGEVTNVGRSLEIAVPLTVAD